MSFLSNFLFVGINCCRRRVSHGTSQVWKRYLSSNEVATALRPFYFAVHPDLFGQHPKEREVNENSLKQLMSYFELVQQNRPIPPTKVTFFLRNTTDSNPEIPVISAGSFREVSITLFNRDLRTTVQQILTSCSLSTDYVNSRPQPDTIPQHPDRKIIWNHALYRATAPRDPEEQLASARSASTVTLSSWLFKNSATARVRSELSRPIRKETQRLRRELINKLQLRDIIWDCGWGVNHFRGCLQSFSAMAEQHMEHMTVLKGRTLVFERTTGVNLDGHVILSSEDVRHSWLELIKAVRRHDHTLSRIPAVQQTVSRVLRDIQVVHRKFQPAVLARPYESHLRKLSASLADYWVKSGYPASWPDSLSEFQLVVECDAGPLMLSPTGQFIVPASCPAFLLVQFLSENLQKARQQLKHYKEIKNLEEELHFKCKQDLNLTGLNKDDNVTPDMMITFCKRLIQHYNVVADFVAGSHIFVSHYYSVLQGGEICIPWNWKA